MNINDLYHCGECRFANEYGQGCKHGILFPVALFMTGATQCPNFEYKTQEQLDWRDKCLSKTKEVRNEYTN